MDVKLPSVCGYLVFLLMCHFIAMNVCWQFKVAGIWKALDNTVMSKENVGVFASYSLCFRL